jgi:hypothetical protein
MFLNHLESIIHHFIQSTQLSEVQNIYAMQERLLGISNVITYRDVTLPGTPWSDEDSWAYDVDSAWQLTQSSFSDWLGRHELLLPMSKEKSPHSLIRCRTSKRLVAPSHAGCPLQAYYSHMSYVSAELDQRVKCSSSWCEGEDHLQKLRETHAKALQSLQQVVIWSSLQVEGNQGWTYADSARSSSLLAWTDIRPSFRNLRATKDCVSLFNGVYHTFDTLL